MAAGGPIEEASPLGGGAHTGGLIGGSHPYQSRKSSSQSGSSWLGAGSGTGPLVPCLATSSSQSGTPAFPLGTPGKSSAARAGAPSLRSLPSGQSQLSSCNRRFFNSSLSSSAV